MFRYAALLSLGLVVGCASEITLESAKVKVSGEIIKEVPNNIVGTKIGQSEKEVDAILKNAGYLKEPSITTITGNDSIESDCGVGDPILFKTYSRAGKYDEQDVEFQFQVYFKDTQKNNQQCDYKTVTINPIKIREPSYMKEIKNAKNQ